jgi:small subunit ribosomal protein S4
MKKQNKKYSRPRKPFDKVRIDEENILKEKYGLKNKREIWKAEAAIGRIRNLAKRLITKSEEEKDAFAKRLQKKGFNVNSISDALALKKEDWLKRRLQTIVFSKKLTNTPKQARQFVSHKHVSIGEQVINIPSYQVSLEQEPLVKLNIVLKTLKPISKIEKIKEKVLEHKINKPEEIEENEEFIEKIKELEKAGDIV